MASTMSIPDYVIDGLSLRKKKKYFLKIIVKIFHRYLCG